MPKVALRSLLAAGFAVVLAGCSALAGASPEPTPMDFPGIAGEIAQRGIVLDGIASGDDGCGDPTLTATAIGFEAGGLGTEPTRLRIYIFRDGPTYDRRQADVDACAATWATDPATFERIDARPFVLVGQGPWSAGFKAALRDSLRVAAGNGG